MSSHPKVSSAQLYLLQWIERAKGISKLNSVPQDAPLGTSMAALRGLERRGLVYESTSDDGFRKGVFFIMPAGRAIADLLILCPACSEPVAKGDRIPLHKCPHKLWCEPAAVERDSRKWHADPVLRSIHRSRNCADCNAETDRQMEHCHGPRHHAPRRRA